MPSFNFVAAVDSLPLNIKPHYYINLAQCLTVANRAIWSDPKLSLEDRFEGLKFINEIMHRVLNRVKDLRNEQQIWTEADMFATFHTTVAACPHISGDVGGALIDAFEETVSQYLPAE